MARRSSRRMSLACRSAAISTIRCASARASRRLLPCPIVPPVSPARCRASTPAVYQTCIARSAHGRLSVASRDAHVRAARLPADVRGPAAWRARPAPRVATPVPVRGARRAAERAEPDRPGAPRRALTHGGEPGTYVRESRLGNETFGAPLRLCKREGQRQEVLWLPR